MPMRKYVPNDRDREIVLRMAAIPGVTRETIAFCITNDRTGRAINRRTLEKHYAKELEIAKGIMQSITMKSFVEQVVEHSWPATRMALSNYCGLKDGEMIANVTTTVDNNIAVRFITSPFVNEPMPERPGVDGYDIDLKAAKPNLLPEWRGEAEQVQQAAKPVEPAPVEPASTEPTPTPRGYKATRQALQERAKIEGWTADKNPGGSAWSGNPNRRWRNGRWM